MKPIMHLLRDSFPDRPEMGPALSKALLERVAAGNEPETFRLSRPGNVVAFGRRDTVSQGYADAVRAARKGGFEAMERLAGGRAAAYSTGTLSLTRTSREPTPALRTTARFTEMADLIVEALVDLGVDARVGEVPGEYCPGEYSVNARGKVKLAGTGQRMITGGAHIGAVLVVRAGANIRRILEPVYAALGLEWHPETTAAVEDEVPGVRLEQAEQAILAALELRFELVRTELNHETLRRAEQIAERHRSPDR